jgi:putative tryptophan/tyrosine transport system substrate-binding protein
MIIDLAPKTILKSGSCALSHLISNIPKGGRCFARGNRIGGHGDDLPRNGEIAAVVPSRWVSAAAGVATDPQNQNRIAAFQQGLRELGWTDGRNLGIDYRWVASGADGMRSAAAELVALVPDVIFAVGSAAVGALHQVTRTVPIVFAVVVDPVGAGFVDNLARPGGNVTGFLLFEFGIAGKWLELLKQIAPTVTRAAVLRDPSASTGIGQWAVIQAMAPSIGVELSLIKIRDAGEIEHDITAFARFSNGGLIVTANPLAAQHRELIVKLAGDHKLPAVYFERFFVAGGGLISYGANIADQYRRGAGYIDRILKGDKPGDLPVQAPTKYELVVNLKTAKALDIDAPPALLARADEVIE